MTLRIRLERRAQAEILSAREWWLANRLAAPSALDEELERAFNLIRSMPAAGQRVATSKHPEVRRVLLGRVRYHLYYVASEETIDVLALWHASRGVGPDL